MANNQGNAPQVIGQSERTEESLPGSTLGKEREIPGFARKDRMERIPGSHSVRMEEGHKNAPTVTVTSTCRKNDNRRDIPVHQS